MFRNFIVVGYSLLSFLLPTCLFLQEKKWLFLLPALLIALVLDFKHKGIETLRCVNGVFVLVLFLAVALSRAISSPSPSEKIALIFISPSGSRHAGYCVSNILSSSSKNGSSLGWPSFSYRLYTRGGVFLPMGGFLTFIIPYPS